MSDIVLDHLTVLDCSPPELVLLAAEAGFTGVGLRIRPMDSTESRWPMGAGSRMLAETRSALADTGLTVSQIEVLFLDEHTDLTQLERELEIGAELGAPLLYTVGMDTDLDRLADRFAVVDSMCAPHGIRPVIEPMAYRPVGDLAAALAVVERSRGGVLIDSLHFARFGGNMEELAAVDPFRLPVVQLCDAGAGPDDVPAAAVAARGQSSDVPPLQWEARVGRRLPGTGQLPLVELLACMPSDTTVALEAPSYQQIGELGIAEFLARGARSLRHVMQGAEIVRGDAL